jgi:PAS domain S-box-containing protein
MRSSSPPAPGRRALFATLGFLVLLVAMSAFLAVDNLVIVRQSRDWELHSHAAIEATQALFSDVLDVESAERGYLGSGDHRMLDHYELARLSAPIEMRRLRALAAENPAQQRRVDRFIGLLQQRLSVADMRVGLMRQGRVAEAHSVAPLSGRFAMDQARQAMASLMSAERRLLRERTAAADRDQWISFSVALFVGALASAGLVIGMVSMALANRRLEHEMAERETAEVGRRESEARYRAVFANTADLITVYDVKPAGRFLVSEVNPAWERATARTTTQVRDRDLASLLPEPQRSELIGHLQRVVESGTAAFTRDRVRLPAGQRMWETVMVPVRGETGDVDRIIGSTRDVTERDEAQARLRAAQRMEAIGHLTGGVAHDFNNLLQVIRGNLELLALDVAGREDLAQRIRNALRGADRAAQLTRQLLAFARRQPLEPKVINLGRLVTDMAEMLRRTLGERIEVETVIAGGLWNTQADPAQVESAILNLAINARDAMAEGGRLTIEITNAVLDESYARRDPDIEPGQYVMLAVSDTGHGIDSETLPKVFEPFFTTKTEEKGTGLGLSMVYGFVKQSRGHIQIYSEVGHGTTVKIYLPRTMQAEAAAETSPLGSLRGHSQVILVVEDEELVRTQAVGMLRDLGYACLHARDGAEALSILESGAQVDLLFTDVVMPGPIKSRDLVAAAERIRPGVPVLFTSGYTENAIVHHGRLDPGVQLLSKPYTRNDLARKVHGMLRGREPVVLIVEDEPMVRLAAVDMVASLGFRALQAGDGEAALAILKAGERVDVLFTDVGLPGMRGPELAGAAKALRPDLKVVFASGYGDADEAFGGAARLGKPYLQEELAEALGAAVAA